MEEGYNVEVTYKIQKDGSGVGVFLNDLPILLLPPREFYDFTKLTIQAARELERCERQPQATGLATGFSLN